MSKRGNYVKVIMMLLICLSVMSGMAQVTSITPDQGYQGQPLLKTTITSSALFLTGSSPQGNIQDIIIKNATDSLFAISDSTNVVNTNTARTFWNIPASFATGLYDLVVRIYNSLSQTTTDYPLANAFNVTTPVWPGDANNDQLVDNKDLLLIGLAYDSTGTPRAVPGTVWQADASVDWSNSFNIFTPAVNYKYADCNGDGIINAADTLAIIQNFNLTHAKNNSPSPWRSGIPGITVVFSKDTVYPGDTLTVSFILGDSSLPVANLYGLAFTYYFDQLVMDSTYTSMSFGNSWVGNASSKISLAKSINSAGQIKAAITRIDHTVAGGYGPIASAAFKITTDNISGSIYVNTNGFVGDIYAIDANGVAVPLNGGTANCVVGLYPEGIREVNGSHISMHPNPADDRLYLSSETAISSISILSMTGEQVLAQGNLRSKNANLDISTLDNGLYLIEVKTAQSTQVKKLLIAR